MTTFPSTLPTDHFIGILPNGLDPRDIRCHLIQGAVTPSGVAVVALFPGPCRTCFTCQVVLDHHSQPMVPRPQPPCAPDLWSHLQAHDAQEPPARWRLPGNSSAPRRAILITNGAVIYPWTLRLGLW